MATKRLHDDVEHDDCERDSDGPGDDSLPPSNKKRKPNGIGKGKHKAKEGSLEYAKKRARTIERLLQRNQELPADVRNDLERELAAHKTTVADRTFQKRRSAMISKYHMVRFFDRKKAMRLVRQLQKKIEKSTDAEEKEKLQRELHVAQVDEAYALHHPHAEPYISIYGKHKTSNEKEEEPLIAKADLGAERPQMWSEIEKAMEEGPEALKRLRERRSTDDEGAKSHSRPAKQKPTAQTRKPVQEPKQESRPTKPTAPAQTRSKEQAPGLNRRERRRLMHQNKQPIQQSDEEDEGEGFFDM